ncbi:hypothetical protein HDU82_003994 [Entophlyctis luteolus]|nr:hypothetical protein HDU82_003994 [Entophlyctis luteolus]
MGNDGGSIPKRHELVTLKQKPERPDQVAQSDAVWTQCALAKTPLVRPVVACALGRLYCKESVLRFLVDRGVYGDDGVAVAGHIASLKDIVDLKLYDAPVAKDPKDLAPGFVCPVTLREFGGPGVPSSKRPKMVAMRPCGCVVAFSAVGKVATGECLACGAESTGTLTINPIDVSEIEAMRAAVDAAKEARAARKLSKKNDKKRKTTADDSNVAPPLNLENITDADDARKVKRANISIPLPKDLATATSSASIAAKHSDAIKSLYAKDSSKPKGNFLTMGTFNRYASF